MRHFDCLIVGAGIHGLCTAFWLRLRGMRGIVVLDQHGPAHDHGSSHGATRIARSSYHEPGFVRLASQADAHAWPVLERELGQSLRVRTPGLFFGPPAGPFGAYLRATLGSGAAVEAVTPTAASRRFPLLRIGADDAVLLDHTAAMVLAAATMAGLREWLQAQGVVLLWHTKAQQLDAHRDGVTITTPAGALHARRAVLAAGPWLGALVDGHASLVVQRQEVGYFDVEADEEACSAGAFPVWARIGLEPNDFQYGLPSHGGTGLKAAQHRTAGLGSMPDTPAPPVDRAALLALARARFRVPVHGLRSTERCLYTMSADQGFRVAAAPAARRITTIAACSGHAFKFGPVIGKLAADLVAERSPG